MNKQMRIKHICLSVTLGKALGGRSLKFSESREKVGAHENVQYITTFGKRIAVDSQPHTKFIGTHSVKQFMSYRNARAHVQILPIHDLSLAPLGSG